jgi:hypothetical protein
LNASNAAGVKIPRAAFLTPIITPQPAETPAGNGAAPWLILAGVVILVVLLMFILKKLRNTTTI